MNLDDLVNSIRNKGCLVVKNKTVRDACGFEKLFDSVFPKIKNKLETNEVALGSPLTNDQEGCVLLYDNRKDSDIRKLLELAVNVQYGKEFVYWGGSPSEKQLRQAARAAFQD